VLLSLTVVALLAHGEPSDQSPSCHKPFDVPVIRDGTKLSLDASGSGALADLGAFARINPSAKVAVSSRYGAFGNAAVLFVADALEQEGVKPDLTVIITSGPRCPNCGLTPPEGLIPVQVDVDCAD